MDLVSVTCPNCGAALPPRAPSGQYVCDYCASPFSLAHGSSSTQAPAGFPPKQAAPAPSQFQVQAQVQAQIQAQVAQAQVKSARTLGCLVPFIVIITAVVPVGFGLFQSGVLSGVLEQLPGNLGTTIGQATEHLLWDNVAGPPSPCEIGGQPAFVGRTRKVLEGDQLFVDAYAAADGKRLWRIGPLGSYSDSYQNTLFAVAGGKVVVSDAAAKVHIHDLATGTVQDTKSLSDRVAHLCVPDPKGQQIWINQVDERAHLLDVKDGSMKAAEKPPTCFTSAWESKRATEAVPENPPKIDGFEVKQILRDGKQAVALGVKHPGTAIPRAAGLGPKDIALWNQVVAAADASSVRANETSLGALAAGRLFATYGVGQEEWRVTAMDAGTGARLWDTKLRPIFAVDSLDGLYATATHVFLVRTSSLEVYDAKTGELRATIGSETYD